MTTRQPQDCSSIPVASRTSGSSSMTTTSLAVDAVRLAFMSDSKKPTHSFCAEYRRTRARNKPGRKCDSAGLSLQYRGSPGTNTYGWSHRDLSLLVFIWYLSRL